MSTMIISSCRRARLSNFINHTTAHYQHHTAVAASSSQTRNVTAKPSANDAEARANVVQLYRDVLKSLSDVKQRFNVPGELKDMRDRVRSDFEKFDKSKMHKTLIDALVFRGYNQLEEMQKHFQTRPHVLRYFSENENLNRALQGKRKTIEAVKLEEDEAKKQRQLEHIRATDTARAKESQESLQKSSDDRTTVPVESDAVKLLSSLFVVK